MHIVIIHCQCGSVVSIMIVQWCGAEDDKLDMTDLATDHGHGVCHVPIMSEN